QANAVLAFRLERMVDVIAQPRAGAPARRTARDRQRRTPKIRRRRDRISRLGGHALELAASGARAEMLLSRPAIRRTQSPLREIVQALDECPAGHVGHPSRSVRWIEPPHADGEIEPGPVAA